MLGWVAFTFAFIGAILNAQKRVEGFYFWLLSNGLFIWINLSHKEWGSVATFVMFTFVTIYAIYNWRKSSPD